MCVGNNTDTANDDDLSLFSDEINNLICLSKSIDPSISIFHRRKIDNDFSIYILRENPKGNRLPFSRHSQPFQPISHHELSQWTAYARRGHDTDGHIPGDFKQIAGWPKQRPPPICVQKDAWSKLQQKIVAKDILLRKAKNASKSQPREYEQLSVSHY